MSQKYKKPNHDIDKIVTSIIDIAVISILLFIIICAVL
jgi:hypothetical protein